MKRNTNIPGRFLDTTYLNGKGVGYKTCIGAQAETDELTTGLFESARIHATDADTATFLLHLNEDNGDVVETIPLSAEGFTAITGQTVLTEEEYIKRDEGASMRLTSCGKCKKELSEVEQCMCQMYGASLCRECAQARRYQDYIKDEEVAARNVSINTLIDNELREGIDVDSCIEQREREKSRFKAAGLLPDEPPTPEEKKAKAEPDCPTWLNFLNEVTSGNAEAINQLQEFAGTCLVPEKVWNKALVLRGGGSGKSTFARILREMVGPENTSYLSMRDLECQYQRAILKNKWLNMSNIEKPSDLDTSYFKGVVTGEPLTASRKHRDSFSFSPSSKLFFMANKRTGNNRRCLNVNFFYQPVVQNTELFEELQVEIDHIRDWAKEGLERLNTQGDFTQSTTTSPDCNSIEAYKIGLVDGDTPSYIDQNFANIMGFLRKMDVDGTPYILSKIQMPVDEYNTLPEFDGFSN